MARKAHSMGQWIAGLIALTVFCDMARAEPMVIGWVESVQLQAGETAITLDAKLDTGARTSSLHVVELADFQREGANWVRFAVSTGSATPLTLERPVVRIARVRRAGTKTDARPVVRLLTCLAGKRHEVEYTLTDRSDMDYPVLIGRKALAGRFIIDSARKSIAAGLCAYPARQQ
jgi:hypothetical protein